MTNAEALTLDSDRRTAVLVANITSGALRVRLTTDPSQLAEWVELLEWSLAHPASPGEGTDRVALDGLRSGAYVVAFPEVQWNGEWYGGGSFPMPVAELSDPALQAYAVFDSMMGDNLNHSSEQFDDLQVLSEVVVSPAQAEMMREAPGGFFVGDEATVCWINPNGHVCAMGPDGAVSCEGDDA